MNKSPKDRDKVSLPRPTEVFEPEESTSKNLSRTPPKERPWTGALVIESHENLKGKWKDHPSKSLRIECPKDNAIAWLNHDGVVICSKNHLIYDFLTQKDIDKLGEMKVA